MPHIIIFLQTLEGVFEWEWMDLIFNGSLGWNSLEVLVKGQWTRIVHMRLSYIIDYLN